MSTITWFPGSIAGLQSTEGDGKVSFDTDGSIFIERVWACAYANAFSLCPKPRDFAPVGTPGTNTKCITSGYDRKLPDAAIVRATYQGIWNLPFTTYQLEASRYEHPIQYHPNFNNKEIFPDNTKIIDTITDPVTKVEASVFNRFKDISTLADPASRTDPTCKYRGISAYMVASAVWRKTSYTLSPVFGVSGLFKIDAPDTGGLWSVASASQWLKADKTFRNVYRGASAIWEIQESWLYNQNGWLSEIYG
jgi:hypothetical protein